MHDVVRNHAVEEKIGLALRNDFNLVIANDNNRNVGQVLSDKRPRRFFRTSVLKKVLMEAIFWFIGRNNQILLNGLGCSFHLIKTSLILI